MRGKKSLQKCTNTESKIRAMLEKNKLVKQDIEGLSDEELDKLGHQITEYFNKSNGEDRDKFLYRVEDILPSDTKNQIWENNHYQITVSMSRLIEETGKMPTQNQLAEDTGLSRQTIYKHLKSYHEHPLYAKQIEQFRFMADRVLAKVIKIAVQGDGNIKAARLYFEIMGKSFNTQLTGNALINTQNNYIQINGTVLSQETIKRLNPDQLSTIETILKTAIPQPEALEVKS